MRSLAILTIALAIGAANCTVWGQKAKLQRARWQQRSQEPEDLAFDTVIEPHSIVNWGDWGRWEVCPQGEFVVGFQLKTMSPVGPDGDNTALNGIRMYCGKKGLPPTSDASITSTVAQWGSWSGGGNCSNGYAKGFKLQQLKSIGCGDDMAATDMHLYCSGQVPKINGNGIDWETNYGAQWLPKQSCPQGQAISGLRTKVEPFQGDQRPTCFANNGDDGALITLQVGCNKINQ